MKRAVRHWLIVSVIVMGVGITAAALHSWTGGQAQGTVTVGKPAIETAAVQTQLIDVDTPWFSTSLPGDFSIKSQQQTPDSTTELYSLNAATKGAVHIQLAMSYDLTSSGLSGLSGYNIRAAQPDKYAGYTAPGEPAGSVGFRDLQDPYASAAYVVFWPHGGASVTIALTGGIGADPGQLNSVFGQLIQSWVWK